MWFYCETPDRNSLVVNVCFDPPEEIPAGSVAPANTGLTSSRCLGDRDQRCLQVQLSRPACQSGPVTRPGWTRSAYWLPSLRFESEPNRGAYRWTPRKQNKAGTEESELGTELTQQQVLHEPQPPSAVSLYFSGLLRCPVRGLSPVLCPDVRRTLTSGSR